MILNANSLMQHVIQANNEIIKHANVSVRIKISAKEIIVGILTNVFL